MKENIYPRKLSTAEREILFSLLPENKSGYKNYRSLIDKYSVISEGRFGNGNLILGEVDSSPDFSISSSPVFALGNIITSEINYYAVIHLLDEGMIEIQIDPYPVEDEIVIKNIVSYSDWKPGKKSPEKNSDVYQYMIKDGEYLLAICPVSKKIWLHEYKTEVNYIIPMSNFFNELMRVKKVKDEKLLMNPSKFFDEINNYSGLEIKLAFLLYNKYIRRFNLGNVLENLLTEKGKRKRNLKLFGRGLN